MEVSAPRLTACVWAEPAEVAVVRGEPMAFYAASSGRAAFVGVAALAVAPPSGPFVVVVETERVGGGFGKSAGV